MPDCNGKVVGSGHTRVCEFIGYSYGGCRYRIWYSENSLSLNRERRGEGEKRTSIDNILVATCLQNFIFAILLLRGSTPI